MAADTVQSDVFKFVALRPPDSVDKRRQRAGFIRDDRKPEETPVGRLAKNLSGLEDGAKIPEKIKEFIRERHYSLEDGNPILERIQDILKEQDGEAADNASLSARIEQITEQSPADYYRSADTRAKLNETWDRYEAFYLLGRTEPQNLEELTRDLRTYHLLDMLSQSVDLSDPQVYAQVRAANPLVPKILTDLPKPKMTPVRSDGNELSEAKTAEYKKLWTDLVDANRAVAEIQNFHYEPKTVSETRTVTVPNKCTGVAVETQLATFNSTLSANPASFERLHPNTRKLLERLQIRENDFQVTEALNQIQSQVFRANQAIANVEDARFLSLATAEAKMAPGFAAIENKFDANLFFPYLPVKPPTSVRSSIKPLGIGDLKVVKQKLVKYAAGEVAHIENVLRGESKERKHRVLDRTEETLVVSNETDEETTRDTQTTERFELKKESENTIQEQMSVQAGVTVSGSYGAVTFGAHGDFAYSTASQQSNKSSSNFAKEVVDRSVSRIQKKTREERTTKNLHEVEEINTHGIDNKGKPDHVTGIYRWVDKYYQAQIYNYGKRMMFEFIIPEPAAFYEYALANIPKKQFTPPKPFNLKFTDITEHNYMDFVADYNVQGVTPPPVPWKTVSTSITKDQMDADGKAHTASTKELLVPEGYYSKVGVWFDCSAYFVNYPRLEITIGNKIFRLLENTGGVGAAANNANNNSIPYHTFTGGSPIEISVNSYDIISYTLNAYIFCERNWETYQKWQIQVFEKIMSAYKILQADYEQKVNAQQTQAGVVIQGQNPRINREIEKTELKKHCVKLLLDTYLYGSFDAMKQPSANAAPDFDIFDALGEGKVIQFIEQAFEWENITYLFYPYFWGRNSQWLHKINLSDTDPLFTKFLQAGSAKVVLPVHPAYNDSVMYFLENNGAVWSGGDTPRLNDPLFISIADELRNQTDDLFGAVPEGDPWEVILPTTLVYLQNDSQLPVFPVNP